MKIALVLALAACLYEVSAVTLVHRGNGVVVPEETQEVEEAREMHEAAIEEANDASTEERTEEEEEKKGLLLALAEGLDQIVTRQLRLTSLTRQLRLTRQVRLQRGHRDH